jgi:hypothetical protein
MLEHATRDEPACCEHGKSPPNTPDLNLADVTIVKKGIIVAFSKVTPALVCCAMKWGMGLPEIQWSTVDYNVNNWVHRVGDSYNPTMK